MAAITAANGSMGAKESADTVAGEGGRATKRKAQRRITRPAASWAQTMRPRPGRRAAERSPRKPPDREPTKKEAERRSICEAGGE